MNFIYYIFIVLVGLIFLELFFSSLICFLRKSCPWLITGRDRFPVINKTGLDYFIGNGWDSELGWVRRPNSSRLEKGRHGLPTSYTTNKLGARGNPGFDNQKITILAYGDPYTFPRQVNDDHAWPHVLSKILKTNVANFGVGNYGLDQALLRLEREYDSHPAQVVIMGVVPETMCRIHSVWKHFSEYGNTFAFKPRFVLEDGQLNLVKNRINTPEAYFQIKEHYSELIRFDYFYDRKFCRDIIEFPYLISVFKNWRRNSALIVSALTDRLGLTKDAAFVQVMKRNINLTAELYSDPDCKALFEAVCLRMRDFCSERNCQPILLMMPQLLDLMHIRQGDHYYRQMLEDIKKHMIVIDLASILLEQNNIDELFINDLYGGHLSEKGNLLVAEAIAPLLHKNLTCH